MSCIKCLVQGLHEILLDGVRLIGEGWKGTGSCTYRSCFGIFCKVQKFRVICGCYSAPSMSCWILQENQTSRCRSKAACCRTSMAITA